MLSIEPTITYIAGKGDPKRCVPMKISIVTLIKKLFISNYNFQITKIIIGPLESKKIGSLESEKSGPYKSIPGT